MKITRMSDIDANDPQFDSVISFALQRMIDKYYKYRSQNRHEEAKGVGVATQILYESALGDFSDTIPTQRGDL